jgi:hypothetical protein
VNLDAVQGTVCLPMWAIEERHAGDAHGDAAGLIPASADVRELVAETGSCSGLVRT